MGLMWLRQTAAWRVTVAVTLVVTAAVTAVVTIGVTVAFGNVAPGQAKHRLLNPKDLLA